jgi:hypothetical protein
MESPWKPSMQCNTLRCMVHHHVSDFFEGRVNHKGWHKSQCIPVPKKGNLSNPNKWQGIMLMKICSKVFSPVMTAQACTLLDKHGTHFKFGGTPKIGYRDGLFTLKALLNAQHNHNLPSYIGFVDLVKVYNTANHALLIDILRSYGAPTKFTTAIKTIYCNNTCIMKIKNKVAEIPQSIGICQGDNMAHFLFLFLMMVFAETLKIVWKQQKIPVLHIMMANGDNLTNKRICSHTQAMFQSNKLTAYKICNASTSTIEHSHSEHKRTCNKGLNSSTTTLANLDWKCTLDAAHQHPKPSASSPPPHNSSAALNATTWQQEPYNMPSANTTPLTTPPATSHHNQHQ